jgi:hypothetical protein
MEQRRGAMVKVTSDELVNGQPNIGKLQEQDWSNAIQQRIMRLENLMEIVRRRESVEKWKWILDVDRPDRYRFPNLSNKVNEGVLKRAAQYYLGDLGNSSRVDMDTLVEKVLILCTILTNPERISHLDIGMIITKINIVFEIQDRQKNFTSLTSKLGLIEMILQGKQNQALRAAAKGGFTKNNYRRSIKTKKSRKLRSRR